MKNDKEMKIRELIAQGYGATEIALMTGMSPFEIHRRHMSVHKS